MLCYGRVGGGDDFSAEGHLTYVSGNNAQLVPLLVDCSTLDLKQIQQKNIILCSELQHTDTENSIQCS